MRADSEQNVLSDDGKRYVKKTIGSPFGVRHGQTMSCFLCGKHSDPKSGSWRKIVGKPRFVCGQHVRD